MERPGATVIAFPRRKAAAQDAQAASQQAEQMKAAGQRLRQALAGLAAALAQQHAAMLVWHQALDRLHRPVQELGTTLTRYQHDLHRLGGQVNTLRATSQHLRIPGRERRSLPRTER